MNQPTESAPRKRHFLRGLLIALGVICGLALVASATFAILYHVGKSSMLNYADASIAFEDTPTTPGQEPPEERLLTYDDGKTVVYQGKTYVLNENVTAILFIGVDKSSIKKNDVYGNGGEGDCILLIGLDTQTGQTNVVNISRDSYAQVDIYSANGKYLESRSTQLCRAYAYGDGEKLSCENMVKSVSRLLYGLPIQSYVAMDTQAIGFASDAIGGVTLVPQGDIIPFSYSDLPEGEEITLHGDAAMMYLRYRNKLKPEGNLDRMARQKQFVSAFMAQAMEATQADLSTILDLYSAISDYTYTDLSLADATFLLTTFMNHGASFDFSTVKGTNEVHGQNVIYYLDQTSLYETVLKVFYQPAD